jgi:hypothetical protein
MSTELEANNKVVTPKSEDFWTKKRNKRLVIQMKGGVLIVGTFRSIQNGFLQVFDATITGSKQTVEAPWVMVDRQAIAHFHPEVKAVETAA